MWSPPNDSAHPSLRRPNGTCSTSSSGCCGLSGTSPSSDVVFGFGRTAKVELHLDVSQISRPKKNIHPISIKTHRPQHLSRYLQAYDISRSNHQPTTNQPPTNQGLAAQALGCHEVPQGSTRQLPHRAALVRLEVTGTQQGDAVEEIVHL